MACSVSSLRFGFVGPPVGQGPKRRGARPLIFILNRAFGEQPAGGVVVPGLRKNSDRQATDKGIVANNELLDPRALLEYEGKEAWPLNIKHGQLTERRTLISARFGLSRRRAKPLAHDANYQRQR